MLVRYLCGVLVATALLAANAPEKVKVGYGFSPPIVYRDAAGAARGFSVDVLNEAARREKVDIEWTPIARSAEIELREGSIDLIAAGVISEERRRTFWVSAPWWGTELVALTRTLSAIASEQDLAGRRIVLAGALAYAPPKYSSVASARPSLTEAVAAVCGDQADAAIVGNAFLRELLYRMPDSCRGVSIRTIDIAEQVEYGLVARRDKAGVAGRLRQRIDDITRDGSLLRFALLNPPTSAPQAARLAEGVKAQYERRLWYVGAAALGLVILSGAFFLLKQLHSRQQLRAANAHLEQAAAERERALAALSDSERRFRSLIDTAFDWVWELDAEARYKFVSPRVKDSLGFEPAEMIGRTPFEFMTDEDARRISELYRETTGSRTELPVMKSHNRHKDGRDVVLEASGALISGAGGEFEGYRGVSRDVTERDRAQEDLRLWADAFDNCTHGIALGLPWNNRVLTCNQSFARMLGRTVKQIAGEPILSLYFPADHEKVRQMMAEADRSASVRYESNMVRADGSVFPVQMDVVSVRAAGGQILYRVATMQDLSERDRITAEREQLQKDLIHAQKMESIGRLAGGVAHDFNNLLTVINGYSSLCLSTLRPGEPLRNEIQAVRDAGESASRLTRQLLAFSRKQVLRFGPVQLNIVISEMRQMLQRLVGEDVEIRLQLAADQPTVYCDRGQLEQVIMNLVVNARDAMPSGGDLLIQTEIAEREVGPGGDGSERTGRYGVLSICDSGVGMDQPTRARMFEPFFTTKATGKGTGLGLAMVHGIVAQANGHIAVRSEPGAGTTVRICLPLLTGTIDGPKPQAIERNLRGTENILLVEDQREVRDFIMAALNAYGYRVVPAPSADDALRFMAQEGDGVDLILTDVVMPNMSGPRLIEQVRKTRPGIKFLFVSGYPDDVALNRGTFGNEIDLIQKPLTPKGLAEKVRMKLDGIE